MARLPTVGSDNGTWGDVLNDFLLQEHNADGSLKKTADITDAKTKANQAVRTINGKPASDGAIVLEPNDIDAVSQTDLDSSVAALISDSGSDTHAALAAETTPTPTQSSGKRGARWASLGDSLATYGFNGVSGAFNMAWQQMLPILLNGEIVVTEHHGIGGQTSTQILARVPNVIASNVRGCFVMAGRNDHNPTTTIANLKLIYAQLQEAGIEVVPCLLPPSNTVAEVGYNDTINSFIHGYAERHGMTIIDTNRPIAQPSGASAGQFMTGTNFDGTHPDQNGHAAIARYNAPRLVGRLGGGGWRPRLASRAGDSRNLFGDGTFSVAAGAGQATGFSSVPDGGAAGYSYSLVAAAANDALDGIGNWNRIARGANATGGGSAVGRIQLRRTLSLSTEPISVGDRIGFTIAIRTAGFEATRTGYWSIQIICTGSTGPVELRLANQARLDLTGIAYEELTVPAGTTALQINLVSSPGNEASTFDVGGFRISNLTTDQALS